MNELKENRTHKLLNSAFSKGVGLSQKLENDLKKQKKSYKASLYLTLHALLIQIKAKGKYSR